MNTCCKDASVWTLTREPGKGEPEPQSAHCSQAEKSCLSTLLSPSWCSHAGPLGAGWGPAFGFPSIPKVPVSLLEAAPSSWESTAQLGLPLGPSGPKSPPREAPPTSAGRKGAFPGSCRFLGPWRAFLECVLSLQQKDACVEPGWLAQDSTWNVGSYFCSRSCRG